MKKTLKIIGLLLGLLIVIRFTYPLILPVYQVATDSMDPTIKKGDYVMVSKLHYIFSSPKRGDIVMFKPINNMFSLGPWAHRIIGISGDIVAIQNGTVTVNGENVLFPEIVRDDLRTEVKVGHVFQKGDNIETLTGMVPETEIIGKVIYNFSR